MNLATVHPLTGEPLHAPAEDEISGARTKLRSAGARQVRSMLKEREHLRAATRALRDAFPFDDDCAASEALDRFCRALTGYVALSQFGVFRRIAEGEERRASVQRVADAVYGDIVRSTHLLLKFDAAYRGRSPHRLGKILIRALRVVGRTLAARYALEDRLLAAIAASDKEDTPASLGAAAAR